MLYKYKNVTIAAFKGVTKMSFEIYYQAAKQFYEEKGHLRVPISYVQNGLNLGIWIHNMRSAYVGQNDIHLTQEQITLLEEIKMEWSIYYNDWLKRYRKLIENRKGKNLKNILEDNELKRWMNKQKQAYENGKISDNKKLLMEKYLYLFDLNYVKWEYAYYLAKQFYLKYHHLNVPRGYEVNSFKLGNWITLQRENYDNNLLSIKQIEKLEAIGMIWCISEYRFITNMIDYFNKEHYYQKLEKRFYQFLDQQSSIIFDSDEDVKNIESGFQKYLNYVKK